VIGFFWEEILMESGAKFTLNGTAFFYREDNNNNNINNNIYLLQLGCHPVAVFILHVNKT